MAITEERPEILELESGDTSFSTGAFARPTNASGWRAWFFTCLLYTSDAADE